MSSVNSEDRLNRISDDYRSAENSGPDQELLVPLSIAQSDLKCSICHDFFYEPICTSCGHHFCRACLLEWLNTQRTVSTCPECRHVFPFGFDKNFLRLTKPDMFISQILRQIVFISCPLGCGVLIHPTRHQDHKNECKEFFIACQNHVFGCPVTLKRKDMKYHKHQCCFNPCKAAVIGCPERDNPDNIQQHEKTCWMLKMKEYVDKTQHKTVSSLSNAPRRDRSNTNANSTQRQSESSFSSLLENFLPSDLTRTLNMTEMSPIRPNGRDNNFHGNLSIGAVGTMLTLPDRGGMFQGNSQIPTSRLTISSVQSPSSNWGGSITLNHVPSSLLPRLNSGLQQSVENDNPGASEISPAEDDLAYQYDQMESGSNVSHNPTTNRDHNSINVDIRDLQSLAQNIAHISSSFENNFSQQS